MATQTLGKRPRELDADLSSKRAAADGVQRAYPPGLEVPHGWLDCPPMGTPLEKVPVIPTKVPLGRRFCSVIPQHRWFTPDMLVDQLAARNVQVGLVLDLTNTGRYYHPDEWESQGIRHIKIFCRGRGSAPEPEAVNDFCWALMSFIQDPDRNGKHAIVHCTHGFNRTGYMIASYLSRLKKPLPAAVRLFATHRVPGIYKDDYLNTLFTYNHYQRGPEIRTPLLPDWKTGGGEQPDSDADEETLPEEELPPIQHDDLLGEAVSEEEAALVQQCITMAMRGRSEADMHMGAHQHFPGSQPVSLDRSNLALLKERRYWVTWKADGTRYLLLLCMWGTYLVDRSFHVRRVQMRYPLNAEKGHHREPGPHHFTLLDGEMVVDEDMVADKRIRRYLAYDLVLDNNRNLCKLPFSKRYQLIESEVIRPRRQERQAMSQPRAKFLYKYEEEPFSVRRKEFWPLAESGKVLDSLIPKLCHEADGLILQGYDDEYVNGTCHELLKWKFAHMNSVDFLLLFEEGQPVLYLMETRNRSKTFVPLKGARLQVREGQQVQDLENMVIECSFDSSDKSWVFMRVRKDKDTPNAFHVYEKVLRSIQDNIDQEFLLQEVSQAIQGPAYAEDRRHKHS